MKVTKIPGLGRFGIFIDGVDLSTITDDQWMEIGQLHMKNLVTIIRNSNCTRDRQADLILKYGDTRYGIKAWLVQKYNATWGEIVQMIVEKDPRITGVDRDAVTALFGTQEKTSNGKDVTRVSGGYNEDGTPRGVFAEGELLWHSNESGTLTWTPGVALLAHQNVVGSATGFVTTVDYYESVSESFRSELNDMILVHKFSPGKINPGLNKEQDAIMNLNMCPVDAEVPLVIRSPGGLVGLHYSVNTVNSIKGATQKESDAIFEQINKDLFVEKYMYDHWYQNNGDLCLFDNSITLHRRLGNIEGRMCYRIAHDYTNLQDDVYQPYFQKSYQQAYNRQIRAIVKATGITNFKLPPARLIDYVPFLNKLI
jgi:alpha-ketoglutarate-dependent taurine dioxygenase